MAKTVIISGAAGGLGTNFIKQFQNQEGRHYHIHAIVEPDKPEQIERLTAINDNVEELHIKPVDLMDAAAVKEYVKEIMAIRPIDGLLSFVGGFGMGSFEESDWEQFNLMWSLNVRTAYNLSRAVYPYFKKQGRGRMIFIGAKPALELHEGEGVFSYAISKSTLINMAKLINESGRSHGVTASIIAPNIIDTPANREAMPDADFSKWITAEKFAQVADFIISEKGDNIDFAIYKLYGGQ